MLRVVHAFFGFACLAEIKIRASGAVVSNPKDIALAIVTEGPVVDAALCRLGLISNRGNETFQLSNKLRNEHIDITLEGLKSDAEQMLNSVKLGSGKWPGISKWQRLAS